MSCVAVQKVGSGGKAFVVVEAHQLEAKARRRYGPRSSFFFTSHTPHITHAHATCKTDTTQGVAVHRVSKVNRHRKGLLCSWPFLRRPRRRSSSSAAALRAASSCWRRSSALRRRTCQPRNHAWPYNATRTRASALRCRRSSRSRCRSFLACLICQRADKNWLMTLPAARHWMARFCLGEERGSEWGRSW